MIANKKLKYIKKNVIENQTNLPQIYNIFSPERRQQPNYINPEDQSKTYKMIGKSYIKEKSKTIEKLKSTTKLPSVPNSIELLNTISGVSIKNLNNSRMSAEHSNIINRQQRIIKSLEKYKSIWQETGRGDKQIRIIREKHPQIQEIANTVQKQYWEMILRSNNQRLMKQIDISRRKLLKKQQQQQKGFGLFGRNCIDLSQYQNLGNQKKQPGKYFVQEIFKSDWKFKNSPKIYNN